MAIFFILFGLFIVGLVSRMITRTTPKGNIIPEEDDRFIFPEPPEVILKPSIPKVKRNITPKKKTAKTSPKPPVKRSSNKK